MSKTEPLKDLLHQERFKNDDRTLILIGSFQTAVARKQIYDRAVSVGLASLAKNLSSYLTRIKKNIISSPAGYELNVAGKKRYATLLKADHAAPGNESADPAEATSSKPFSPLIDELKKSAAKLASAGTADFILESIKCLEAGLIRPAIVFSWVGAVAVLQDEVIKGHLKEFNTEAARRFPKDWTRDAKKAHDLGRLKEADFLLVLESISLISKNVKQELEGCLKLRNACGHPTPLTVGVAKAAAHVETLLDNVFSIFA